MVGSTISVEARKEEQGTSAMGEKSGDYVRFFVKTIMPICIAFIIAIALVLSLQFFVAGWAGLLGASVLVVSSAVLGYRQGDRFIELIKRFKDR